MCICGVCGVVWVCDKYVCGVCGVFVVYECVCLYTKKNAYQYVHSDCTHIQIHTFFFHLDIWRLGTEPRASPLNVKKIILPLYYTPQPNVLLSMSGHNML